MNHHDCIKQLIDFMEHNDSVLAYSQIDTLPFRKYISEFRTLTLGLPRRWGKSNFIAKNARCGDLILVHSEAAVRLYYRLGMVQAHTVESYYHTRRGLPRSFHGRIWLDEYQAIHNYGELLQELITSPRQLIIKMGSPTI